MATAIVHPAVSRHTPTPPLETPHLSLETPRANSVPIPKKHIPYCPPGPPAATRNDPSTPPDTPPSNGSTLSKFSTLHPANSFPVAIENPAVYSIDGSTLKDAFEEISTRVSPGARQMFPWLHGLHHQNQMQLAFFDARRSPLKGPPKCYRGLTIIKAGGDLSKCRLRGAISPEEVLIEGKGQGKEATFLEVDPKEGFSVRNFHIQVAKTVVVSDVVVYGDNTTQPEIIQDLAKKVAFAQSTWQVKSRFVDDGDAPQFNTFILSDTFEEVEKSHPELLAIGADGEIAQHTLDFFSLERQEMCTMSKATEIAHNVWLGPTPDTIACESNGDTSMAYDILVEASDLATPHDAQNLRRVGEESYITVQNIDFPSSGSIIPQTCPKTGLDPLTRMCQWMHKLANRNEYADDGEDALVADSEGDIQMQNLSPTERKILIHCTDGYTETTLLSLAYFMYAERLPVHEAWLRLHCEKKRNFFAYASDVALLTSSEPSLIHQGRPNSRRARMTPALEPPSWLSRMDGSLPSRILPYLYLGNLGHANNPELLKAIGITQILSVGEPINWTTTQIECWGTNNLENVMYVDRVQDNGVDPLMPDFERCLKFIAKGRLNNSATLVHCRVGVSRSATICIAEVMASLGMSLPRAYCFVRARRLNVIIQPHLRFAYELMQWDEMCQQQRGEAIRREVEWPTLCREIASMNRPYCCK